MARLNRMRTVAVGVAGVVMIALALALLGGVVGRSPAAAPGSATVDATLNPTLNPTLDRGAARIAKAQQRLHRVPGDWRTWAALGVAYLDQARVSADPTSFVKAEGAVARSLAIRPDGNTEALVAFGALANARHDFAAARRHALAAIDTNGYHAEAYAVLADAETQLGDPAAASAAIQRLLDLRPGLAAYARASYDLEQRGLIDEAARLMRQALAAAVDRHDIAFCRAQLGDLALGTGAVAAAEREYAAGLAADPSSIALARGRARAAAAAGRTEEALAAYAALTRRAPTPGHLIEHAELLRAAGQPGEADAALRLATAAHRLFTANAGVDGLTGSALAVAKGQVAVALAEAESEWSRRRHADVADALAWALHLSGRDAEALGFARRAHATGARAAAYSYHLGMIERSLGHRGAAREHLAQALERNPAFSPLDAAATRRALRELQMELRMGLES